MQELHGLFYELRESVFYSLTSFGALGSSFYMLLTLVLVYWLVTLKPSLPGDDPFMKAVGLVIAIIVTAVAGMTCFTITGLSIKENGNKART